MVFRASPFALSLSTLSAFIGLMLVISSVNAVGMQTKTPTPSSSTSQELPSSSKSVTTSPSLTDDLTPTVVTPTLSSSRSSSLSDDQSETHSSSTSYSVSMGSPTLSTTNSRSPTPRTASPSPTQARSKTPSPTSTFTEDLTGTLSGASPSREVSLSRSYETRSPSPSPTSSSTSSPSLTPSPTASREGTFSFSPSLSGEISAGTKTSTPSSSITLSNDGKSKSPTSSPSPSATMSLSFKSISKDSSSTRTPTISLSKEISSSKTFSLGKLTNTIQKKSPTESPSEYPSSSVSRATNTPLMSLTLNSLSASQSASQSQSSEVTFSGKSMTQSATPTQTLSGDPSNTVVSSTVTLSPSDSKDVSASRTSSPSLTLSQEPSPSRTLSPTFSFTLSDSLSRATKSGTAPQSASPSKPSPSAEVTLSPRTRSIPPTCTVATPSASVSLTFEISRSNSANTQSPSASNTYNFRWLSQSIKPSASKLTPSPSSTASASLSMAVDGTTKSMTPSPTLSASASGELPTLSKTSTFTKATPSEEDTSTKTMSLSRSVVTFSPEVSSTRTRRSPTPTATQSLSQEFKSQSMSTNWTLSPSPRGRSKTDSESPTPTSTIVATQSANVLETHSKSPSTAQTPTKSDSPFPSSATKTLSESGMPSMTLSNNVTDSTTPTRTATEMDSGTWTPSPSPDGVTSSKSSTATETSTPTPTSELSLSPTDTLTRVTPSRSGSPEDTLSFSPTPSVSREKSLTKSTTVSLTDPSPTKEQSLSRSLTIGSKSPTSTPSVSTTNSRIPSVTKQSQSYTSTLSLSEEPSSSRSRSHSKGTASPSQTPTKASFSKESSFTRSLTPEVASMTPSGIVAASSSIIVSLSASEGTPTFSSTGGKSETVSDVSHGHHVKNATVSLTPSQSMSATMSKDQTLSKTKTKASFSQEASTSASLLPTPTRTPRISLSPSLKLTPSLMSQTASVTLSKQSATKQMTISTSASQTPSASLTASREFASVTKTRTPINSVSPSQSSSFSTTSSKSKPSKSVSPSQQIHSKTHSASPTASVSYTMSLTYSQEISATLSKQLVATVTRSLYHISRSLSNGGSESDTSTISRSVSRSYSAQVSISRSSTVTKELSATPSSSSSPSPNSLTFLPSVSFQPDSSTATLLQTHSNSAELSLTLSPMETNTTTMTFTSSQSSTKDNTFSYSLSVEPASFTKSLSPTLTADIPSMTHTSSQSRSLSFLGSQSKSLTDSRSLLISFTNTTTKENTMTRSISPEQSPSLTLKATYSLKETATVTKMNSASLLTQAFSFTKSSSAGFVSTSRTRTIHKVTSTMKKSKSPSLSVSATSEPTATKTVPKGTVSLSTPVTGSPSDSDSPVPSLSRSDNFTFTITKPHTFSRKPSGTMTISKEVTRSITLTGTASMTTTNTYSLTETIHRRRGGGSATLTFSQSVTITLLSTPTHFISETSTETMSINTSHTLSRNSPSAMFSSTITVSLSQSQMGRSKTDSSSSSATFNPTATRQSQSQSPTLTTSYTFTTTESDSDPPTASSSLVSTKTLTITPPPTPTHSSSDAQSISESATTTNSESGTQTFTLRITKSMLTPTDSTSKERSESPSDTPSHSAEPSESHSDSLTPKSISEEMTLTTSASKELSDSFSFLHSVTQGLPPTRTKSLLNTETMTLKLSVSLTMSNSATQDPASSSMTVNLTDSLTMSSSYEVTSTNTLVATNSISVSPTQTLDYISPNAFFATSPFSSVYVYTAGRFLAIRFQGIPFNTTGDRMMLSPVTSSCDRPPSGGYVFFSQSSRQPAAGSLIRNNWTAFPKLSGQFSLCYFTTTSLSWHKIILPTASIQLYAAVPGTSVLRIVNNTAVFSEFTIILYGGNRSSDRPFIVKYGQSCAAGTRFYGALKDYNNNTFVATMDFFSIPTPGDYAVCYLGYPHLSSYVLLLSGTRRIRINGGISSAVVGSSMIPNFKVGHTISYSIRGIGLSVRDSFFLTNATLTAATTNSPPPNPCSMPYNVDGAVRVSWGQIQRVVPTDQTTSVYNLNELSVNFFLSVPYNLSMCYRSNYSSTFTFVLGPLPYPVDPILPTFRAPNMSTIATGGSTAASTWSLGGSFLQTFFGEGVNGLYDEAFLVLNMSVNTNITQALISTVSGSTSGGNASSTTTFTAAAVALAGAGCINTTGALAVVKLTPSGLSSNSVGNGVSYFVATQLPALTPAVQAAILATGVGIPATVCYKSNFSYPFNMGTVQITSTFWNTSDVSTRNLFAYGAPLGTNVTIAIGSDAVAPGNSSNTFYLLFGISAQCISVPPLSAINSIARNQTHVTFTVSNRGIYQLCAVCGATGTAQNASFPVTPNNPNTLSPSLIGLINATTVFVNGGVDFTATTAYPDVLYTCNTSLANAVTIKPLTSNSVLINASIMGNVSLCIRYGVQRDVTAIVGTLTVSPLVHNVRTTPDDHRVGAVITIYVEGYGLTASDSLYPCLAAAAALLPIQFVSFSCANKTSTTLFDTNLCVGIFNATATGSGSFPLCYSYAGSDAFPAGSLLNLSTGASVALSFDALSQSLAPSVMFASILSYINITGNGMATGVVRVFLKSTPRVACEGDANPTDAIPLTKFNTSKGTNTASSTVPDNDVSWSQWTLTTSVVRGLQALCYVSNSGAAYTAGYITVKSVVSNFTTTQPFVTTSSRYASVPMNVVVTGAAMLVVNDTFFMVEQSTYTCANGSGRSSMSVATSSAGATGLQTSIAFTVTVPVFGTYKICYLRRGSESDGSEISSPTLTVSSSFVATTTSIALVGSAPFLAPLFRFSFSTNITQPLYTPYRTVSNASTISVLYVPLGYSILYAELVGVNGLTTRVIQETMRFPVTSADLCTNFPQSLLQSDTKYQFAMSFIALYNFDASYCYNRIPTDYSLGPTNLINEFLTLISSDVALMVNSRTTLSTVSRVALNTPQTASRSATLMTSLLTSTADSLNIPNADITSTLLLSHTDIVNEIINSAIATVDGDATTTQVAQSTVLQAVNRLNLVGAKYCASGLASGTTTVTISEAYFSASVRSVPIGSATLSMTVAGPSSSNSSQSVSKGINVSSTIVNPLAFVGCVMPTLTPKNFIPSSSSTSSHRTFDVLATGVASSATVSNFNMPLMSMALPASTLSNPLGALSTITFSFAHPGIPNSNLTLGVGIDATFYRFSPTSDGSTSGTWILDTAATASATNSTV
ncbi:membrane-associated protein, putative, partial [Bodo saltans]